MNLISFMCMNLHVEWSLHFQSFVDCYKKPFMAKCNFQSAKLRMKQCWQLTNSCNTVGASITIEYSTLLLFYQIIVRPNNTDSRAQHNWADKISYMIIWDNKSMIKKLTSVTYHFKYLPKSNGHLTYSYNFSSYYFDHLYTLSILSIK